MRARDPEALGRFFDRYLPVVYGLLLRLLGDEAAAEDATQDVFLKVHRAIDRIDPERDPQPWLTTIAYNACRDLWRSAGHRMRRQSSSLEEHPELGNRMPSDAPRPDEALLRAERERIVQDAIGELPPPQREVVVLHDYHGMTHDEIATMVGASHAAIRKRYSRAVAALGKLLQDRLP